MRVLRVIDLFSGAGGLTAGFTWLSRYPYESVWANDINGYACHTYNENFGEHCVTGDIVDILASDFVIPKADVVIGGPPCQGFSLLNKNRAFDPRKALWLPFMEVVERCRAQAFVMENVPQLLGTEEHAAITERAEELGFQTWSAVLLAADYGAPQLRRRAVVVGCKKHNPHQFFPPAKTNYPPNRRPEPFDMEYKAYERGAGPWRTVRDAIGDLPKPVGTEIRREPAPLDLHFGRNPTPTSLARYKAIPGEGMNRFDLERLAPELTPGCWKRKKKGGTDLFGRLWWNRPAFTIRTEFFKPEKGRYLHPRQHRPITHREAARLQTFPDEFVFCGTKIEIARQIGNAVPAVLAARIADRLYEMLVPEVRSEDDGRVPEVEAAADHVASPKQGYRRRVARKVPAA